MRNKVLPVSARLDPNLGQWWIEEIRKTKKSSSEVLRDLVLFRIAFESNPWLETAKFLKTKGGS